MQIFGRMEGLLAERARTGPVKFCKRCGRTHPARGRCHLIEVDREAKSGRIVKRKVAP